MQGGRLGPRRVELLLRDVYGRVCPAAMDRFDEVDDRELHPHDLALVEPTLEAVLGERIGDVLLADRERAEADGPLEELAREGEHVVATVVAVRLPRDARTHDVKGVARLSDMSEEHEAWYQARLLCFWDEEELKKPFADRTPRPFDETIRMLKAETARGHCFLGFEKEVHHEFRY